MHYDVSRTSLGNRQHGTGTATAFTALRVPALSNATLGRFRRLLEEHLHGMDDLDESAFARVTGLRLLLRHLGFLHTS